MTQRGFTLLEMLVVVVIIGILATFATLSIGNRALDDRMEVEARRLAAVLKLAEDEAEFKGVTIGFAVTADGYRFLSRDDAGDWQPYSEAEPLRPRTLSEPFYAQLLLEGRAAAAEKKIKPQALFLSSGEATEFSVSIKAPNYAPHYRIDVDILGKLSLKREDETS